MGGRGAAEAVDRQVSGVVAHPTHPLVAAMAQEAIEALSTNLEDITMAVTILITMEFLEAATMGVTDTWIDHCVTGTFKGQEVH